ncbi:hypothetical protein PybrP1_011113 [[Pythium] brassicae (nom. inval.)]|nr:hypothetical protein PybrP1_011113 [[Pythium] brassicae (nom. inval.)]
MLRLGAAALVASSGRRLAGVNLKRAIAHSAAQHFPRANRALELKYKDGACTLAVPLPLSGFDEERVFSIAPEATVASIIAQIEAEDTSVKAVDIRSKRGKSFRADETLHNILKDDFEILLNDRVLPVTAPVFAGNAYVSLADEGELDVRSVVHKAAVISLRHHLETLGKWKISFADFELMCKDRGIPKKQAPEILRAFHQSGVVFAFRNSSDEDLQGSIFLQPRSVVDSYLESLGLSPVSARLFDQEREALLAKIRALEPEHVALVNLRRELHAAATRHANGVAVGLSTGLVGTFGLYFWLSFVHFSWDIMEPVTYFSGFGMSVIGYAWWSVTKQEYEYANIYDYFYQRKLRKLVASAAFDQPRLDVVAAALGKHQRQLAQVEQVLLKPTHLQASYLHLLEDDAALGAWYEQQRKQQQVAAATSTSSSSSVRADKQ